MKITDVQAHVLAIPMAPGKQKMPWTWGNFNQVIISVHTEAGLTGYGEAFGYGGAAGHRLGGGRNSQAHAGGRRRHADHSPCRTACSAHTHLFGAATG